MMKRRVVRGFEYRLSAGGRGFESRPLRHFSSLFTRAGVVVQLVRIPACHAGGRGFESRPLRHVNDTYLFDILRSGSSVG